MSRIGIFKHERDYLHLIPWTWDGTLTGKNLLPKREQILLCKGTIPCIGSEVKSMEHSIPAQPWPFHENVQ